MTFLVSNQQVIGVQFSKRKMMKHLIVSIHFQIRRRFSSGVLQVVHVLHQFLELLHWAIVR